MSVIKATNQLTMNLLQQVSYGIGQNVNLPIPLNLRSSFQVSGDLADQCDLVHSKTYTFTASTPQVIDLRALTDALGAAIVFARVKLLAIRVNGTVDGAVLLVGANGSNDWLGLSSSGSTVTVYPSTALNDGFAVFQMPNTTGAAVTTSAHLLKLDPGANAFTVDLLIAGNVA